jgi:hypothetical protein
MKSHWHYGIVKDRQGRISVREIYIDNKGVRSYTLNPVRVSSESLSDLEWTLKAIRNDFRRKNFYTINSDGKLEVWDDEETRKIKPNSESCKKDCPEDYS